MRNLKISKQITDRSGRSIEAYLREVAIQPMITIEEEVYHAKRIKQGDMDSLEKLVRANLRFAISVAKQYQHHGLPLEDLISEANIGLIKAAERFDETRGFKFISYAVWWIRQSILKAISEKSRRIRLPINRAKIAKEIADAAVRIEQFHERTATEEEIGEMVNLTPNEVREVLDMTQKSRSIDAPMSEGEEDYSMKDFMEDVNVPKPNEKLERESLLIEIDNMLSSLGDKDAEILKLSFGLNGNYPMSLEDIGVKLDMSKERVRQLREKALKKLRHSTKSKRLKNYLA
ncbi:MAG: RNA polymerase sigma factor RpoD/SigA [Chitinophagales bacterium]|nr:RNA polymerase sigma factor RpoD/SigA [Chitinophagales bacterium]